MTGPDVAGVLAGHVVVYENDGGDYGGRSWFECSCDHDYVLDATEYATESAHRAHVAAAVNAEIGRWLASEAQRQMHERGGHWHTVTTADVHTARVLSAIAEQLAPESDGGGS